MNRKIFAIIVLGLVLLSSLLACGYFGVKMLRRTRLRRAAMEAYEKKEYALAERLLLQYIGKDPNGEAEFVALANIYHEFGNTGMEAQMWQTASALNPLNSEYREKMLTSAVKSASYDLLHGILGQKARLKEQFTDEELYLYVISSCRSGYQKDADDAYRKAEEADSEAFHKSELGQMAEFLATCNTLSEREREDYLRTAMESEAPVVRFEAILFSVKRIRQQSDSPTDRMGEIEALLKQAVETNYYAGTLYLADFYFSQYRFRDVISILGPYLKTIDDPRLYLLFAESCVFEQKRDEFKELEQKLRRKPGALSILAEYCGILNAFLENDEDKLVSAVRKAGNIIISPLSRLVRLRVAMKNGTFNEIRTVAQEFFSFAPFHDLHDRALLICLNYIAEEMEKTENRKDPSQLVELAKILSGYLRGNRMLTEIILFDQYKKGLVKEEDLKTALKQFPDDALLQRITAEYLVLNGKSEEAISIIEAILEAGKEESQEPNRDVLSLYMLALDQLKRYDEASVIFQELVEQSEFNLELLNQYFQFCEENKREADLTAMADKLEPLKDGKLEHYGKFFRAAAMFASEDKTKEKEALDLLASTPTDDPDFTFSAANRLCDNDRLDEAEEKYMAILKTYRFPSLIYVNLSELYHAKGDEKQALEAAKEAFDMEKKSMLPAFIYARRLSEAERYQEAVDVLRFPRHAVTYREDVIELWTDCMKHVIEKSMADRRFLQAEEQCKHLLVIDPDDEFGKAKLEEVREILLPKKDKD